MAEARLKNSLFVVKGYFKETGTKTVEDIMADVLKVEHKTRLLAEDEWGQKNSSPAIRAWPL
ncbi:hypothetical protein [Porcincola intestinalis]|uniref:Uncharacterized protein n=1 Tax=Porcincola intestinalis TaxID=2606632 RepID=A0A6L5X8N9_9FIRM|nr:hypothetical protein [Porcincola intestinalis]MDY5282514.1 hypothetical protein [Porcincola intestinalis]MSS15366.1 hypothetical protein [Porcincola intestinalis]